MSIIDTQNDIFNFLNQFATPYYEFDHQSTDKKPNNLSYPFITFSAPSENWRETGLMQVRIWDKMDDYVSVFEIAYKIEEMVKEGYNCNSLVIHQGSPFVQVMPQDDENIKCLYINLEVNYL